MKSFWQKHKWGIMVLGVLLIGGFILAAKGVSAESLLDQVGKQDGVPKTELPVLIANIIKIVLGLVGIVLVILIIWAGILWMTAGGEEKNVTKAKGMLSNAIIGLVIIVLAYTIAQFVTTQLNKAVGGSNSGSVESADWEGWD